MTPNDVHVLVCGAGFGGMSGVRTLTKAGMRVTILDGNLYSTFQPLLYQVATGGLNPGDISYPVGDFARRYGAIYRRGSLAAVDAQAGRVKLTDGRELSYDYLVVASGVSASHFGIKGAAEHSFGLYTRHDAVALRDQIMAGIERLTFADGDFHVTVVGGGATGVELAGTLSELRREVFRATFPDVDPARLTVRLVEMAPALLTPFHPKLQAYALTQLRKRSVEVLLETEIAEVTADRVVLGDGRTLPSQLTVWAAGVAAAPAVAGFGLPQGSHGRLMVGGDLRVQEQERIFAVGDIAVNPDDPSPQLAQPALQMGKHAARQIVRLHRGQPTVPFAYHDKGIMATIGRRSAVVQLRHGARFRGTLAWVAWLALHLMYLLGYRNRVTTLINLAWRYLSWGHGGAVIVGDNPEPAPDPGRAPRALVTTGRSRVGGVMRRLAPVGAALLAAGVALVAAACSGSGALSGVGSAAGDAQSAAALSNPNLDTGQSLGGSAAPDFQLTDQFGRKTSLSQYRGKVVLLDFNDSRCTTICPLTTQAMVWATQLLGPAGDSVALLGIDANPDAISVSDVLAYSRAHNMVNRWDFLTGTLPQLTGVWKAYSIAVQIQRGQIDHTPALYVIDQQGRERELYLTQMAYSSIGQSAQVIAGELASLLPGHPRVRSTQSLAQIPAQGPAADVTLPPAVAGGRPVSLGPGKPHLVMFVATWLSETSDLAGQLKLADAYQAYASQHHLPQLAAVDEMTTEPSRAAVQEYFSHIALHYPIGLDADGRVADGYAVQDQPWFALLSSAGKIVWSHDGWLPLRDLESAAARAQG